MTPRLERKDKQMTREHRERLDCWRGAQNPASNGDEQDALAAELLDLDDERLAECRAELAARLTPALVGYAMASLDRAFCPRCGNRLITEAERQP
jgi:hypothetical protein